MSWDIFPAATMTTQDWGQTSYCGEWAVSWLPDAGCGDGLGRYHAGVDLGGAPGGNCGMPIHATRSGTVVAVGANGQGNAGFSQYLGPYAVCIHYDDGMYVLHGHLQAAHVTVGQAVVPDDWIGDVGTLGSSSACHLHVEARTDGAFQGVDNQAANVRDPRPYLNKEADVIYTIGTDAWPNDTSGNRKVYRYDGKDAQGNNVWTPLGQAPQGGVAFIEYSDPAHPCIANVNGDNFEWDGQQFVPIGGKTYIPVGVGHEHDFSGKTGPA